MYSLPTRRWAKTDLILFYLWGSAIFGRGLNPVNPRLGNTDVCTRGWVDSGTLHVYATTLPWQELAQELNKLILPKASDRDRNVKKIRLPLN